MLLEHQEGKGLEKHKILLFLYICLKYIYIYLPGLFLKNMFITQDINLRQVFTTWGKGSGTGILLTW